MNGEWLIVAGGALLALGCLRAGVPAGAPRAWAVAVVVFSVAAAGLYQRHVTAVGEARAALSAEAPSEGRPGGFVSSQKCRACHPEHYDSWHRSYHRTMTQYPSSQSVLGDFDDVTLEFEGEQFHLSSDGGSFVVDMVDPDWSRERKRGRNWQNPERDEGEAEAVDGPRASIPISLLTGSHHMQAYWVPSRYGNLQLSFPFTYLVEDRQWVPRADVFLYPPDWTFPLQSWNKNCVICHATFGQVRADPATAEFETRAAEIGIACEACHGPAAEHVEANADPRRRYDLHRDRDRADSTIFNPARADNVKASEACGLCHAIRQRVGPQDWNREGFRFRPGGEIEADYALLEYDGSDLYLPGNEKKRAVMQGCFWDDGMVRVSGRDFSAMAASACYKHGELSCLNCHSMHGYADRADQLTEHAKGDAPCLECHTDIAEDVAGHTHHESGSAGSACYNCHMPYTAYGLLKAIRSHHITSPSVAETVDVGRPNACNACHIDRTLAWTAEHLKERYGIDSPELSDDQGEVAAAALWALTGDAGQRALAAWYLGWDAARAAGGDDWQGAVLARLLDDPYAAVRYLAQRSLKRLPGFGDMKYDYTGSEAERSLARSRAVERFVRHAGDRAHRPEVLMLDAQAAARAIDRLLATRDDRPVALLE